MSDRRAYLVSFLLFAFMATSSVKATEKTVTNATELSSAIASVQPGDVIIMSNGTWTNVAINLNKAGSSSLPITLRSQEPGKVVLNGTSTLTFAAAYWIVDGLNFNQGALSSGSVIRFNSDNGRLTNCAVINYNPPLATTQYYWIYYDGSYNRVDHCYMEGKNHAGPTVGNDASESRHNQFDNNYIYDIPYIASVNGREIFRVWGYGGSEELGTDGAFFTIENNLFEKADGEGMEIISLKSNRNIVRYNTIKASRGGITLRSGNYNTVQGNFILGQNATGAYGMRVTGQYHKIFNNYIADCPEYGINMYTGEYIDTYLTTSWAPIFRTGTPLGRVPAYSQVRNCTIAFNTMVNITDLDLEVGGAYKVSWPTAQRVLVPENNTISNNLIVKRNGGTAVSSPTIDVAAPLDIFTFQPNTYEGNVVYGGSMSLKPAQTSGFSTQNPSLILNSDGLYRLASNSSAINTAAGTYPDVTEDMDGQMRNLPDVGADEYSAASIARRPLSANDVGPAWLSIAAPSNLAATAISDNRINLVWVDNSANETGFKIERSVNQTVWDSLTTVSANVTSYSNTGLDASLTYYYRVMAINVGGISAYTNVGNASTLNSTIPPSEPSGLTCTLPAAPSDVQVLLSWSDNSRDEVLFKIERSADGFTGWISVGTVSANITSFSDAGLLPSTKYYYRLRAENYSGNSAYTSVSSITTALLISNITLNKTVTPSNVYNNNTASYGGEKAVDGSISSRWATDNITSATLDIDFGGDFTFAQAITKEYSNRISSYKIQYWNGSEWADACTGTTIGTSKTDNFSAVTGSKVRLNILSSSNGPSIFEFAIYGYEGTPSSLTNPINPAVLGLWYTAKPSTIGYYLQKASTIKLSLFDLKGNELKILVNGHEEAGIKGVVLSDLPDGIYFARAVTGHDTKMIKLVIHK